VEVVVLSPSDSALLSARYAEHANSFRRMLAALQEAGAADGAERLRALRKLEIAFDVDLGMLCHWYESRDDESTHPVARTIIRYIVQNRQTDAGQEIWMNLDRVRELRTLMEEDRLVGEPES